ncbi:PaaI family thioesterase [Pontivivens ytuae]|uniref:PaaI family thioesterase n=1 Tax=Pontivivens ytuae TaxID=2789856 RepID=A0A7S9LSC6_9RHOB|nr:PaaI family thioesterase [Pontivivens ytuae]QPH54357.1 PaaI family thioesterase [Pontivivens ytuae]
MSDRQTDDPRLEMARRMTAVIPHSAALGMHVHEIGDGLAVMSVPYDRKLVGDPATGVMHGGVITTLLDGCCGTAVMTHPKAPGGTATIDLRIDYMRAATPEQPVTARAECYRITRNVAFVRAIAHDGDPDNPVAQANGAFTVEGRGTKIGETA